jgi:hypothetical protein
MEFEQKVIETLDKHVRVNLDTHTVEFFDEYGVKMVLRDLTDAQYAAYLALFKHF